MPKNRKQFPSCRLKQMFGELRSLIPRCTALLHSRCSTKHRTFVGHLSGGRASLPRQPRYLAPNSPLKVLSGPHKPPDLPTPLQTTHWRRIFARGAHPGPFLPPAQGLSKALFLRNSAERRSDSEMASTESNRARCGLVGGLTDLRVERRTGVMTDRMSPPGVSPAAPRRSAASLRRERCAQ